MPEPFRWQRPSYPPCEHRPNAACFNEDPCLPCVTEGASRLTEIADELAKISWKIRAQAQIL